MKIIYVLTNNIHSHIQLSRFLKVKDPSIDIKIFSKGISNYFDSDINLDYFYSKNGNFIHNKEFEFLYEYIKKYDPDLLITDGDYRLPILAFDLNIPCINYSIDNFYQNYITVPIIFQFNKFYITNLLNNSVVNLIPGIADGLEEGTEFRQKPLFTTCRPFTFKGNKKENKKIHISKNNKSLSKDIGYSYSDINSSEYFNSLASSDYCLIEFSYTYFIDAYYNNKFVYCYKGIEDSIYDFFYFAENKRLVTYYENNFAKKNIIDFEINSKQLTDYIKEI